MTVPQGIKPAGTNNIKKTIRIEKLVLFKNGTLNHCINNIILNELA